MPRLTKRHVDGAPSRDTPYFLWCSELPGFGVRVFPTGKRVYYADYYNSGGTRKRMSIGAHGKITTEEARKLAIAILGAVVKGDDPAEERATGRKSITVRELCDLAAAERGLIMGKRVCPRRPARSLRTEAGSCGTSCRCGEASASAIWSPRTSTASSATWRTKTTIVEKTTNRSDAEGQKDF